MGYVWGAVQVKIMHSQFVQRSCLTNQLNEWACPIIKLDCFIMLASPPQPIKYIPLIVEQFRLISLTVALKNLDS